MVVAIALVLLGIAAVAVRAHFRREMRLAHGDSIWRIAYDIDFDAAKPGAKFRMAYPADTPQARVFRQELNYSGLTPDRRPAARRETREVDLATDRAGPYHVTARFDVHVSPQSKWPASAVSQDLSAKTRNDSLLSSATIQSDHPAVLAALQRIRAAAAPNADLVRSLVDYCTAEIGAGTERDPADAVGVLQGTVAREGGKPRALAALCRAAKVPARLVAGFALTDGGVPHPRLWVEVLQGSRWQAFDPENGYAGELPANYLPVRRGSADIVWGTDLGRERSVFSVARLPPPPGVLVPGRRTLLEVLDLTRLPLEAHQVVSLILLMPLGALVTAIFRTFIGIRTFGTFTPTLLALSFVYADWHTGLFVFAVVLVLGLSSRALLDRIKLLVVPRLSAILTVVVLCMVFCISLLDYAHLTPTPQAVLLPMVILTMTIERFFINMEEDGVPNAFRLLGLTVLVAFCCYLVLRWNSVGQLLLAYPETHLVTIAVLILMGRYTGYRLTELWRFRDLGLARGRRP